MTAPIRILVVVVVLLIAAALFLWWRRPPIVDPGRDQEGALPPEEAAALVRQLNLGIAHLENDQLDDAISGFQSLTESLVDEVAGWRDLLVAQVLNLEKLELASPDRPVAILDAEQTRDRLLQLEPDSLATLDLAARLAAAKDEIPAAMQRLAQATEKYPDDLPTWYQQYSIGRYAEDEALRQQALAALNKAYELAPTNLVVLLEQLQAQLDAQDPAIVETLQKGMPRWEQLAPGIQQRVRVDLLKLVEDGKTAAEAGDWQAVRRSVLVLKNVVTPEEATRSDRRLVERHLLEYVLYEFSPEVMSLAAQATPAETPVPIAFDRAADPWQLPASGTVLDITSVDFDLDTLLEVACLQDGQLQIFRRQDQTWAPWLAYEPARGMSALLAVDLDDDVVLPDDDESEVEATGHPRCHQADLDLVLFGAEGVTILQNSETDGQRTLQPVEIPEALAQTKQIERIVPADLDADGDLDLLVLSANGQSIWGNRGNFEFTDDLISLADIPEGTSLTAALPIDWDDDLDLDIVVADNSGQLALLENLRHGEFQWRTWDVNAGEGVQQIAPLDRDGAWDLLIAGQSGLQRLTSSPPVAGRVELGELTTIYGDPLEAMRIADFNNDGPLDVVGGSNGSLRIWIGQPDATLTEVKGADHSMPAESFSGELDVVDLDDDGRLDLIAGTDTGATTLSNVTDPVGGWVDVSLLAEQIKGSDLAASGRVNHYGIGSVLELRSGVQRQRQIATGPVVHFGLGSAERADSIRVQWTNGVPENVIEPASQTFVCERQTLKGSCPYLYGWNGEEFAFITDLLWASPIGLVGPDGQVVPARPWENLKIAPDQLVERDGKYELRLTEELWEAAYLDSVQLTAIDHPEDVEIFTNEKVGPPHLAEPRLYTVRQRLRPRSAIDQQGRNVLPLIRNDDERYAKLFDQKLRQGYTEPTTLELELGDFASAQQVTLFLTGWIYPTDTTINVALSQNAELNGPVPLSLQIPDADGNWETVIPFTGFPGGKTKTIAIDLSDSLLSDDYRARLATSQELYWDAIFYTVDEPDVEFEETILELLRADLRERGVSAPIIHPQHGPERYDYETVSPSPWRPMDGDLTRLGDVRELLAADDSRLVVMGSGDEVVLEFEAPPPPKRGWVRSFVLRNVGWDKDADLHTIYGQTIEPLPLIDMSAYPIPAEEVPADPEYLKYLQTYQTRRSGW